MTWSRAQHPDILKECYQKEFFLVGNIGGGSDGAGSNRAGQGAAPEAGAIEGPLFLFVKVANQGKAEGQGSDCPNSQQPVGVA